MPVRAVATYKAAVHTVSSMPDEEATRVLPNEGVNVTPPSAGAGYTQALGSTNLSSARQGANKYAAHESRRGRNAWAIAMKAAPANTVCRHCGAVLDALARRRGVDVCGAAPCRHQANQAHTTSLKRALSTAALAAVHTQLRLQQAPSAVVWLQHCEPRMIAVDDDDRDRHRAYLESVITDGIVIDHWRFAGSTADGKHPQEARLCAQCRGRCCVHGASWHAFIDLPLLSRWVQENPACSLSDAVDAYVAMLPAEHVRGACLYQTAAGCAMPRERRADICNDFACEALQQVQRVAERVPAGGVLAITLHGDQVERAAVIEADATHTIALETPTGGAGSLT